MSGENLIKEIASGLKPQAQKLKIAVLTSGDGKSLQSLIDQANRPDSHFSISLVITNNKKSLALKKAHAANIESFLISHKDYDSREPFEDELSNHLKDRADLIVLAGFLRVLSPRFLARFPKKVINLHPSLLPKHPGLDAINKARISGDEKSGCTVHLVDDGLDTGPIIAQMDCPILKSDDTLALKTRIQALEHKLLPQIVESIARASLKKR